MKTDEMKFEDGCYVIPEQDFTKMIRFFTVVVGALHKFPEEETSKAVKEQMEKYNFTKEEGGDFLLFLLDLLKLDLRNELEK